jgi:hypothetical protein
VTRVATCRASRRVRTRRRRRRHSAIALTGPRTSWSPPEPDTHRDDAEWLASVALLAHACAVIGHTAHADALYRVLVTSPAAVVRLGPIASWWGPVDHHLGALCRVLGRTDEAVARLEHALEIEHAMNAAPFTARTNIELARTLMRSLPPDHDRARELLLQARSTAERLGASALSADATETLGQLTRLRS